MLSSRLIGLTARRATSKPLASRPNMPQTPLSIRPSQLGVTSSSKPVTSFHYLNGSLPRHRSQFGPCRPGCQCVAVTRRAQKPASSLSCCKQGSQSCRANQEALSRSRAAIALLCPLGARGSSPKFQEGRQRGLQLGEGTLPLCPGTIRD